MGFSITEYGQIAGLSASTIRYYEAEKLLPIAGRKNGRRIYYSSDIPRLKLLAAARKAGFTIREIKQIINQNENPSLKHVVVTAAKTKVNSIEQQIQILEQQRQILIEAQFCPCPELSSCIAYG